MSSIASTTDGGTETDEVRTVDSPTYYPKGTCPACGESPHHFPRGVEVDGVTVYWTCGNCTYAAEKERERRAQR